MDPNQSEQLVEQTLRGLKGYVVVGKSYIRVWHAWLLIGIIAGLMAGVFYVANRTGKVEKGSAASTVETNEKSSKQPWWLGLLEVKVKAPSTFSLYQGQSAKVLNFKEMRIVLTKIIIVPSIEPAPPAPMVRITVSSPGGCGPGAAQGCIGPPAFQKEYPIVEGETVDAAGLQITFSNLAREGFWGAKRATFNIITAIASSNSSGLSFSTSTNKPVYFPNENIQFAITAKNNSANSKTLQFTGGCQATYKLYKNLGERSKLLFDYSSVQACTEALTSVTIPAGGSYAWNLAHEPRFYQLYAGPYKADVFVVGYGAVPAFFNVESLPVPTE